MAAASYGTAYKLTLAHEGGYVNHVRDPGGATYKGVTKRVYDGYRRANGLPLRSVKLMEDHECAEIYATQYWAPIMGDRLPAGVDYAVYDFAVNSGVSRAVRYLQRVVGVDDDGQVGMVTLGAVRAYAARNEEKLILDLCGMRMNFLRSLSTFDTFGKGWTRRVVGAQDGAQDGDHGVVDYAIKLARADGEFGLPAAIGARPGEVPAKAYGEVVALPTAPMSYADLKQTRWAA